jgi:hypothetical protein
LFRQRVNCCNFLRTEQRLEFTLKFALHRGQGLNLRRIYLIGICAAPDAGTAGAEAVSAAAGAATLSNTLLGAAGCKLPKYARANVHTKNVPANTAVVRDKKLALPLAPNKLPEPPLPKAAPISAPFPCCTKIRPIIPIAANICMAKTTLNTTFILNSKIDYKFAAKRAISAPPQ